MDEAQLMARYLDSRQRLMTPIFPALGSMQVTPTQEYWKDTNAQGIAIEAASGQPINQANLIRRNPDGTTDMVRMNSGDGRWYASGRGARDVRAGRP